VKNKKRFGDVEHHRCELEKLDTKTIDVDRKIEKFKDKISISNFDKISNFAQYFF
jgi:hypothetical protein